MAKYILIVCTLFILTISTNKSKAQSNQHMLRIAKIEVDPGQLSAYNAALDEQMKAAINLEPGVLSYYAVSEKGNPAHITIFETYADESTYQSHIQTTHFKKYKATVANMVKKLELTDVNLLISAKKPGY